MEASDLQKARSTSTAVISVLDRRHFIVDCMSRHNFLARTYVYMYILVGECSALWASGSDPADASADVSMHTAHAGERTTQR